MINVSHFENKRLFCLGIYQAALMLWQHSIPMTLSQTEHMENSEITFCVCVYVGRVFACGPYSALLIKRKEDGIEKMNINFMPILVISQ